MNSTPDATASQQAEGQREALNDSEKQASRKQPGSYKEAETADKMVEIPPTGPDAKPIRGLDSK